MKKTETEMLEHCKKNECPKCGSTQISGESVEIMAGSARQDVCCLECEAEWAEFYTMGDFSFYGMSDESEKSDAQIYAEENPR